MTHPVLSQIQMVKAVIILFGILGLGLLFLFLLVNFAKGYVKFFKISNYLRVHHYEDMKQMGVSMGKLYYFWIGGLILHPIVFIGFLWLLFAAHINFQSLLMWFLSYMIIVSIVYLFLLKDYLWFFKFFWFMPKNNFGDDILQRMRNDNKHSFRRFSIIFGIYLTIFFIIFILGLTF